MFNRYIAAFWVGIACLLLTFSSCRVPSIVEKSANATVPARYAIATEDPNSATSNWKQFFNDPYLTALIDTALKNNQELNITLQEIEVAKNEARIRKGEYLPSVGIRGGAGVEKAPRYTRNGAVEATTEIRPGEEMPEPLPDFFVGAFANWEVDVWRKLRNARESAVKRYLASTEGRNFMVTNLVSEVAVSYYELLALDNQLEIIRQNIQLQNDALEIMRLQKTAARVTELAVKRFEAQVLNTKSLQFSIQQQVVETENRINFLLGRFPQPIPRNSQSFSSLVPPVVTAGLPAQLLENRPDIRQAELELAASKLDVKVAKARFYPSLGISAGIGYQAFNPRFLLNTPESVLYSLAGDLTAPLVNRNAIKATYYTANAKQIQAAYNYERTILNAYVEVANQLSKMNNLKERYDLKARQVQALNESITISNDLFRSARADYMEVLLTQRDVLEARFEQVETRMQQMETRVNLYRSLGGGWKP